MANGWKKHNGKWWYQTGTNSSGKATYYKSQWAKIGGKWYHFDKSGYMQTGWFKESNKWYWLGTSGAMATGWYTVKGVDYYSNSSGVMQTGWVKIGATWYYFTDTGAWTKDTTGKNLIISNLNIKCENWKFTGSWKVPAAMKNGSSDQARLFQFLQTRWQIKSPDGKVVANGTNKRYNLDTTSDEQKITNFKTTKGDAVTRNSFYPYTPTKVGQIFLGVAGMNYAGLGSEVSMVYNFKAPAKPTISTSFDDSSQTFSAVIETEASKDNTDRVDTMYRVRCQFNQGKTSNTAVLQDWTATTSVKYTYNKDLDELRSGAGINFADGTVVTMIVEAYARGIYGDAPSKTNPVTAKRVIAYPGYGSIKNITVTSKASNGRVVLDVASPGYTSKCTLERLNDVTATATPETLPTNWSSVEGAVNNGNVEFFYDIWSNAHSEEGTYTWYRLKNENCGFTQYSAPKRADALFIPVSPQPTAEDDEIGIVSVMPGDDGKTAVVVVGWNEDKPNTGTEITWSDNPYAWESTDRPNDFEFSWKDKARQSSDYQATATVYLSNLKEGETVYIRARRYLEGDSGTTYTGYSNQEEVTPVTRPTAVNLYAPEYVQRGEDIELTWTFASDATQRIWQLHLDGAPLTSIAAGTDARGFTTITPEVYGDASVISMYVSVGTGGDLRDSNVVTVGIADAPVCYAAIDPVIDAQPVTLEVLSDKNACSVLCTVKARGIQFELPDKDGTQLEGDVVYTDATDAAAVSWQEVAWSSTLYYSQLSAEEQAELTGNIYKAEHQLVYDPDFIDTGEYMFDVGVVDSMTGIASTITSCAAAVEWSHQAPAPSEDISIEIDDEELTATITLVAPEDAVSGDVYDIYRQIPGGWVLIGSDLALDNVVVDRYPPYGSERTLAYRICTRTSDGDIQFDDYSYDLPLGVLRFDFNGSYVELPYNISLGDSYKKDFEARPHIDGSINGYWNKSVEKTGSYKADTFRTDNAQLIEQLRKLAKWPGSAFCRTSDSQAFQCNVDVSLDSSATSGIVSVGLSVTEVKLTSEFMLEYNDVVGNVVNETGVEPPPERDDGPPPEGG